MNTENTSSPADPDEAKTSSRKLDETDLNDWTISPGDLVIDCGASVGDVVAVMSEKGAEVYAFEPNPVAFERLSSRFSGHMNITCRQVAVSDRTGTAVFYPHENLVDDPEGVETANGSSLLDFKSNVSTEHGFQVETIDLADFLRSLARPVRLLKIDIEGAEIAVVNRLLDEQVLENVERVLVETHERKIPELLEPTEALRQRIADEGLAEKVSLDWH